MRDRLRGLFGRGDDPRPPEPESASSVAAAAAARIDVRGSGGATDDAATAAGLDDLRTVVRAAGAELPTVISSRVRHVEDQLRQVSRTVVAQGASTEQRYLFQAIVGDYVPTPVRTYRSLPPEDRTPDSATTRSLAAQLDVVAETVEDMHEQIRSGAIAELSAHGRFLQGRLGEGDPGLRLPGAGS
ncbi:MULTISPECIES: hypothetical protein [unclassified Curtobacterium]|uniref:hypothetical protein n=1 Tax=unclassified Curtobacterium TaxID=257496 RepID=UPI0008DE1801|nr:MULTISPECIES: hypothetical protein [unclassified Curtobacterium]OIH98670.1 hypothetical protein BIU92_13135 [Curtobacterium sp. MCBA15_003]OII32394.1 hypothetical protein BIU94_03465 [Curtobacterium sp. MMLR14_006]WIE63452.1 hypothetical protein DEI99_009225 [Curtobacterium sp. MCLR17_036]